MKILTLNTHSLIEENYADKLKEFVKWIIDVQPDVFSLQEVNQSLSSPKLIAIENLGYVPCKGEHIQLLLDNHAIQIAEMLRKEGLSYEWTWIPLKIGYGRFEEGLAIFSKTPIEDTTQFFISKSRTMDNWKTRKMLGIRTQDMWFYCVHMGWWDDKEEPFAYQWDKVQETLGNVNTIENTSFIMGDFNCPAQTRGEGYDYVKASGWKDTWELAREKDSGITVSKVIDGWEERAGEEASGMRIDFIWCNRPVEVLRSEVVFNGKNRQIVSDHYGVEIEVKK